MEKHCKLFGAKKFSRRHVLVLLNLTALRGMRVFKQRLLSRIKDDARMC
jgi:hypothetical protein